MSGNKRHTNRELLDFFRSRISGLNPESRMRYRKTLSELDLFLTGHHLQLADFSAGMTADWTAELLHRGLAKSTVAKHLNFLNSMMGMASKESMLQHDDSPRGISKSLSETGFVSPPLMHRSTFDRCLAILRNALKGEAEHNRYVDMLLLSILNGAVPLEKIALLKKEDTSDYGEVCRAMIERNQMSRRNYVFDLRQSYLTSRQLHSAISTGLHAVFAKHIGDETFNHDDFARSLWVACAMRSGLTASEALGCVGGQAPYTLPAFCIPASISPETKQSWTTTVNSILLHEMPRWYAMHLRRGIRYEEVKKDISDKIRPCPELFYPCETIIKFRNGQRAVEEHPYISQTVFFKSHPENIHPLFSVIGEKAWCYRVSGEAGAPYAVIPDREMERFQSAVGVFTPGTEIRQLGELTPKPGESVIVVMPGFGNRAGEVENIINKNCGSAIFRVRLTTDRGYEFRIDVDGRQLERIAGN